MMDKITVSYQGEPGAYSEGAAIEYFNQEIETLPCHFFDEVFTNVETGTSKNGFIPIENSLAGSIHRNYDLLLKKQLHIVGEFYYRIKHCLLCIPGSTLKNIKKVYSHPQALAQCEESLKSLNLELIPEADTAGSARLISENRMFDAAAIASKHAAAVYGLDILAEDLEDNPENYTRFLVISNNSLGLRKSYPPEGFKTSIVFNLQNKPGSLFKALSVFALRDIDLMKIESRPIQGKPWEYMFYIDFMGHVKNQVCMRALEHLQELAPYLRVLGSYPRHQYPFASGKDE